MSWDLEYQVAFMQWLDRRQPTEAEWDFVVPPVGAWIKKFRDEGPPDNRVQDFFHPDVFVARVEPTSHIATFDADFELERAIIWKIE